MCPNLLEDLDHHLDLCTINLFNDGNCIIEIYRDIIIVFHETHQYYEGTVRFLI